jgi:1A family penicillin-binding protein
MRFFKEKNSSHNKRRAHKKTGKIKILLFTALAGIVALGLSAAVFAIITIKTLPSPEQFGSRQVNESSKLYDRTGKVVLYEIHGEEKRTIVPFEDVPERLKQAVLAAEDINFYNQPAFDWKAIARAIIVNIQQGKLSQGGSTITQQLVKNVLLSSEKTFTRKVKELFLAIELESKYSKDEIFSFYLNQIPFGSNAYGVEAASQIYFNKDVGNLTIAESAVLASILKAPSYYSPWGNNTKDLTDRKDYVIDRMVEYKFISSDDGSKTKKEELKFAPPSLGTIKAPHFSLAVKDYLVNRYGEQLVMNGGLKVITTLDVKLQELAEKSVTDGTKRNEELYGSKNAALVAQDPKTGQILAMVGSRDYFDIKNEGNFNVATQGLRQPGSALKPFVYMTAFEKGYTPKTVIYDVSTEFDTRNDPATSYRPENFDATVHGPVKFEEALARSLNIPAVKVLYLAGFDDVLKNLHKAGITSLNERWRYGLSLTLGGGEVKLIDLVNAYATLSQEGVFHQQKLVLKVEDGQGNVLEEYNDQAQRVFEPQYPRLISQIISDPELRKPIFGASLSLTVFPEYEVALKTGTSEDHRDAWAMGYTPSLTIGVWAGNNDNSPMIKQGSSILAAVPIWNAFLKEALKQYPKNDAFTRPDPYTLPNKPMLDGQAEFVPMIGGKAYPQIHSILYYVDRTDPTGPAPENPGDDPQFSNWETGVMEWARTNIPNFYEYNKPLPDKPDYTRVQSSQASKTAISNVKPANGEFVKSPLTIEADLSSDNSVGKIELYFNRRLLNSFSISSKSYHYSYFLNEPLDTQNLIELKVTNDQGGEVKETIVVFH